MRTRSLGLKKKAGVIFQHSRNGLLNQFLGSASGLHSQFVQLRFQMLVKIDFHAPKIRFCCLASIRSAEVGCLINHPLPKGAGSRARDVFKRRCYIRGLSERGCPGVEEHVRDRRRHPVRQTAANVQSPRR